MRTRTIDGRVEIEIEDNGRGIDSGDQARVFEPLFSTRSFGVGLGLPLVKQIMDLHEGGVELQSRLGAGTRVTLWLNHRTLDRNQALTPLAQEDDGSPAAQC